MIGQGIVMSLRHDWNLFWFSPRSSVPLGLFRLIFGALVLAYGLLLFPDRYLWFSHAGMLTLAAAQSFNGGAMPRLNLFDWGLADGGLTAFFIVFLLGALGLMLGLWTRPSALIVFVCLNSLHNRNHAINNSGDIFMMVMAAYLLAAPAGAACSLDRLRRILRGVEDDEPPRIIPWVVRLMQIQVCLVYLSTSLWKIHGTEWWDGIAAYYPMHLPELARFPLPWMDGNHLWVINLMTYGTLATELALGTLVWAPRLRLYVLAAGVGLHLGIEYSLNIPLFSFLMIASYSLFLRATDLERFIACLQEPLSGTRLRLVYDGQCDFCRSALLIVRFLDVFRLTTFLDCRDPAALRKVEGVLFEEAERAAVAVDMRGRQFVGFYAFRILFWRLPALWLMAPLLYLPGIPWLGRRVCRWVAENRSRLPVAPRYISSV